MRTSTRSQLRAGQWAILCALAILYHSVLPSNCSLAAYSETRSFRDALEGRSMEEAISGPVDKDTSSYGDRTTASAGAGSSAGSSMLTIPANGNVMSQRQQQQSTEMDQQEKSPAPEIEREAGPIGGGSPMDTQQQMMEQKSSRQSMRQSRARSGRLQEQQQMDAEYPSSTGKASGPEAGFGDEQAGKSAGAAPKSMSAYGSKPSSMGAYGGSARAGSEEQQPVGNDGQEQQQQMASASGQEQEPEAVGVQKSYQADDQQQQQMMMLAKQKAMAAMLMGMSSGSMMKNMKYARNSMAPAAQYGADKDQMRIPATSTMAQSMMNSLANKAAYASSMSSSSQRQVAPPMMTSGSSQQQPMYRSQMRAQLASGYGDNQRSGPMRRANQRRGERKMSPAMVNAMLNKMLSAKQEADAGYSKQPTVTPAAMMMMKAPAKAEMLANMMVMSSPQASAMSAATKEQYKKMMMSAIMQQTEEPTGGESGGYQQDQQQQQMMGAYGGQEQTGAGMGGYSPMSPMSMVMRMMGKQQMSTGYGQTQSMYGGRQQQQQPMMSRSVAPSPVMSPMMIMSQMMGDAKTYGDAQQQTPEQQMMMPAANNYGPSEQQPMMTGGYGNKMTGAGMGPAYGMSPPIPMPMARGKGRSMEMSGAGGYEATTQSSYAANGQQQEIPTDPQMGDKTSSSYGKSPMNGFRQAYSQEQPQQQQQQQQQEEDSQGAQRDYGMQQPQQPEKSMGATKGSGDYQKATEQQKQESSGAEDQQQQQEDGYGAAPMGMAEPFAFDYKIDDNYGNGQYRKEESDKNGVVRGSYGYMDNSGIYRHVEYVADEKGFRANIKSNEPGLSGEPATGAKGSAMQSGAQMSRSSPYGGTEQSQMQMQMPMPMTMQMAMPSAMPMATTGAGSGDMQQQQQMYSPDQSQAKTGGEKS